MLITIDRTSETRLPQNVPACFKTKEKPTYYLIGGRVRVIILRWHVLIVHGVVVYLGYRCCEVDVGSSQWLRKFVTLIWNGPEIRRDLWQLELGRFSYRSLAVQRWLLSSFGDWNRKKSFSYFLYNSVAEGKFFHGK